MGQPVVHAAPEITERIEWNKTPIQLNLKVNHERMVHFPGPVKVGIPESLRSIIRVQSVNGTVYLLAQTPFEPVRVMVRDIDAGQVFLFDVSAQIEGGQVYPVQVFMPATHRNRPGSNNLSAGNDPSTKQYSYVALTRFAAQQLYARLVQDKPGIVRVPVARKPVALLRGGAVAAVPIVAWRAGGLYLTAVKLNNISAQPQILDPRNLRGSWLTATFQHNRLLPAGDEADTTAVYLISARPFEASQ
jgi:integrating conjugative element protein (TIGR03749 family)